MSMDTENNTAEINDSTPLLKFKLCRYMLQGKIRFYTFYILNKIQF